MKKILIILFSLLFFSSSAQAKVKSQDIKFPLGIYTENIEFCKEIGSASLNSTFLVSVKKKISSFSMKDFIGFDWSSYHTEKGDSRDNAHDAISMPVKIFASVAHNGVGNNDEKKISEAIKYAVDVAKAETLLNTITKKQLEKKPRCWKNGDPSSPCWFHQYSVAKDSFTAFMIGASWLKPHMNEKDLKIIDTYIQKFWKKYYKSSLKEKDTNGFYQQANGGLGILIYAHWSDNKKLAANEINFRFKRIDDLFMNDGYIKGSSFRGNRSQWYHTYGVNSALGYIWIAKQFGAEIPKTIENKVINSLHVSNLAIIDREKFLSREWKKKRIVNTTRGGNDWYTNPEAFGMDILMSKMYGIELKKDPMYLQKRKIKLIDHNIGFNPHCIK